MVWIQEILKYNMHLQMIGYGLRLHNCKQIKASICSGIAEAKTLHAAFTVLSVSEDQGQIQK